MSRVRSFSPFGEEVSGNATGWKFKESGQTAGVASPPSTLQDTCAAGVLLDHPTGTPKIFSVRFRGLALESRATWLSWLCRIIWELIAPQARVAV